MKARLTAGGLNLALGLLFILVPHYLLPVCDNTLTLANGVSGVPMKCFWSAMAESGLGGVVILSGLLICLTPSPEVRLGISIMNLLLALLAATLPSLLIGVCANEAMACRLGTLPALYVLAGLLMAVSLINIGYLRASMKKGR